MTDLNMRLRRAPDAVWRDLDGEVAIISVGASRVRLLNGVGSFVWKHCDGRRVQDVIARVTAEYAVDEPVARRDVETFVDDLLARGLLVPGSLNEPSDV